MNTTLKIAIWDDMQLYRNEVDRYRSIISKAYHELEFDRLDNAFSILGKAIGLPPYSTKEKSNESK